MGAQREIAQEISLEDIKDCFHMKQKDVRDIFFDNNVSHISKFQAAVRLGVKLNTLKTQALKYGIQQWPYRQIKAVNSKIDRMELKLETELDQRRRDLFENELELLKDQKQLTITLTIPIRSQSVISTPISPVLEPVRRSASTMPFSTINPSSPVQRHFVEPLSRRRQQCMAYSLSSLLAPGTSSIELLVS